MGFLEPLLQVDMFVSLKRGRRIGARGSFSELLA